jgi:hypothetical protein
VIAYRDIEERCRSLVDAARFAPVLGRQGWSRHDRAASDRIQQWAAQLGIHPAAEGTMLPPETPLSPVSRDWTRQAAARAAARARCAEGIRCTECHQTYGAIRVTLPGAWLCANCIPLVKARVAARGYSPDIVQPDPVPGAARYIVSLFKATGHGAQAIDCDTPQRAQFIAETEHPFNNTEYDIWVPAQPRH